MCCPALIFGVTLLVRRFGPIMGGLAMGFPLLTGPISVFTALEQGTDIAAHAATTKLVGQVSPCVFCFVYTFAAPRYGVWLSAACGIVAFLLAMVIWCQFPWSLAGAIALFIIGRNILHQAFPKLPRRKPAANAPWWEQPARMLVAGSFVFAITTVSSQLGAQLSGLIAPFPVFVLILVVFTHLQDGHSAAVAMTKGGLLGSPAFGCFFVAVALGLQRLPVPAAYSCATVFSNCCSGGLLLFRMRRVRNKGRFQRPSATVNESPVHPDASCSAIRQTLPTAF